MLDKRLIRTERTEICPADGKTRGRALGCLEKQIEGRDRSMCAGCQQSPGEQAQLPFLNVITRGDAAALRVRSIKPTQKAFPAEGSLNVSYSYGNGVPADSHPSASDSFTIIRLTAL